MKSISPPTPDPSVEHVAGVFQKCIHARTQTHTRTRSFSPFHILLYQCALPIF